MKSVGVKLFCFFVLFVSLLWGQTPYEVTKRNYKPQKQLVHDFGKMFSDQQRTQLEQNLVAYNDSTSVQIVVVTFKSLEGYPIETLGNEIGEYWGVGQKDKHNGIVIVLSNDDRKVTIRGGYGIQVKMPATIEKLIIDREMIPEFKKGDYYQGILNAIDAIYLQLQGQYVNDNPTNEDVENVLGSILVIFIVVIVFLIIASKNNKGNHGNRGGGTWKDVIITPTGTSTWGGGSWSKGGSWGGSSGGGFGGFGGGSFGGGGASGSW